MIKIEAKFISSREKSIRVEISGRKFYLPRSKCDYDFNEGCVTMPMWIARKKGILISKAKGE